MSFTDKQSLDDLNIFGVRGLNSIYNTFNKTSTVGGAVLMEEMFRSPLTEPTAINKRSAIIKAFMETSTRFPFMTDHLGIVEEYLKNSDMRSQLLGYENDLARKLRRIIGTDIEFGKIQGAVVVLIGILKQFAEFAREFNEEMPYYDESQDVLSLLVDPDYQVIFEMTGKRLSFDQVALLDKLFRFRKVNSLNRILQFIYRLDVYLAIAKVAQMHQLCFAKALLGNEHRITAKGLYHLHVSNAIGNDIHLGSSNTVMFLTGANMAGKSTFMKTIGIALFLAHAGFPVPAKSMEFSVLNGIYTTINLPDNLGMGYSHFYAEVLRVKKIAEQLGHSRRIFVVFDELFRGTNVKDAYEATVALVSSFSKRTQSFFIISTHILEAAEVLKESQSNIGFSYLPTLMDGNRPVYPYKLETGISADRHGMIIINNERILDIIRSKKSKSSSHEFSNR